MQFLWFEFAYTGYYLYFCAKFFSVSLLTSFMKLTKN